MTTHARYAKNHRPQCHPSGVRQKRPSCLRGAKIGSVDIPDCKVYPMLNAQIYIHANSPHGQGLWFHYELYLLPDDLDFELFPYYETE